MANSEYSIKGEPASLFLDSYRSALDEGNAAIFCGAGVSIGAGFGDWRSLLTDVATSLGLDIGRTDLISLAQYGSNRHGRNHINELILEKFASLAKPNALQDALVRLPVDHAWTTNYDSSLEDCYRRNGRVVDVKLNETTIASHRRGADVAIYKMHGDVSNANDAVITKEDYEAYALGRRGQAFSTALQADLFSRTFLFVGFSFSDPNLDQILSRVRHLIGDSAREHYCIMKRPASPRGTSGSELAEREHDWKIAELQIEDLEKRYKIRTVLVDAHDEVPKLISRLGALSKRNNVFVSGAVAKYEPMDQKRLDDLLLALGARLEAEHKTLVSGLGIGVGAVVARGFFESAYIAGRRSAAEHAILRPFPQPTGEGDDASKFWSVHRRDMLGRAGFVIFVAGNKVDLATGTIVRSNGMDEEFDIASEEGAFPIPIGATGNVAHEFWEKIVAEQKRFYASAEVSAELVTLGNSAATNTEIVGAILAIMKKVNDVSAQI